MPTSNVQGASVEGSKIGIRTRQFYSIRPRKDAETKKVRYGFKLGINGHASVVDAYEQATSAHYSTSMLAKGDAIQGESIFGWSLKPFGEPHIGKGSATHSAAMVTISGGCLAQVLISPRQTLEDAVFMAQNPPIVPVLNVVDASSKVALAPPEATR